jgi:hypothetical protein
LLIRRFRVTWRTRGGIDEVVGIAVQLSLVSSGQKPCVAGHHPQRLLGIVGGDVGELRQLFIRAIQFVDLMDEVCVGGSAHADVADRRYHDSLIAFSGPNVISIGSSLPH